MQSGRTGMSCSDVSIDVPVEHSMTGEFILTCPPVGCCAFRSMVNLKRRFALKGLSPRDFNTEKLKCCQINNLAMIIYILSACLRIAKYNLLREVILLHMIYLASVRCPFL